MTLCEKILLVDDLINENPEVTIRDYLETVKEIESISQSGIKKYRWNVEKWGLKSRSSSSYSPFTIR